ncbi:MAG: nucleotidyltransferase family protein [Desulfurococcaceae archaeon]|nr:nucleotidyltransferase family protein [Desulfurococcaceae archaeon]MCC6057771.1 nucleotidyltransferase family protein [Desulfurococcaceae archaeon]
MKAVILAGGYGKRLRPLTEDRPKPMVEVCGRPLAEWQILWLKSLGITEVVFLLGYAKEKVIEYFGSGKKFGVNISYVVEDEPLGTGGAIKNAEHILKNEDVFIVVNGDIITNLNPLEMVQMIKKDNSVVAIALVYMRSPYGIVKLDGEYIVEFVEKPTIEYTINAGVYVMKPTIFEYLPEKGDIERTAFPLLASKRLLKGYVYKDVYWKSIDTIKDLEEASERLRTLYPDLCIAKHS